MILAVEWGSGRRKGWLSNLHLGRARRGERPVRDARQDLQGPHGRDAALADGAAPGARDGRDGHVVHVRPELVVEIAFSDVQESPRYPAGLALRFARVKRHRPDKPAAEADTLQTVTEIFRRQRA